MNPWTRAEREQVFPFTAGQRGMRAFFVLVMVGLVAMVAFSPTATSASAAATGAGPSGWPWSRDPGRGLLGPARPPRARPGAEIVLFARGAGTAVLVAALLWLFYLALEPYVRRLRPWTLVSWARLLEGGTRDAVVGRDVLIGLAWGTGLALLGVFARALLVWLGRPETLPELHGIDTLVSTRLLLSYVAGLPVNATLIGLALLLLFLVLRLVTRRDLVAVALVVAFLVFGDVAGSKENAWPMLPFAVAAWGSFVAVMLRFGVLAAITAVFTANLLSFPPLVYAPGSWTGAATFVVLPLLIVLGVLAFRWAVGGHSGLRRYLAGDTPSSRPT